jgi:hypothetical protein
MAKKKTAKAKTKKPPEPKAKDFFKPEEIGQLPDNYNGHWLIVRPTWPKQEFRKRRFLVWQAQGGFGCDPTKIGRAVFAECAGDGEHGVRFDRGDFVGEFIGDLEALKKETD